MIRSHRAPKSKRPAIIAAVALALVAGASFYAWNTARLKPVDNAVPAVAGTYTCVVVANGAGFDQSCVPVASPSGTPTVPPSASPSPTATVPPTTPAPSPTVLPSPTLSMSPTPTQPPSPSPSATQITPPPAGCPVAGHNVPGAADPWGGCFPGPGNTGVPAGTTLTAYTGACTIIQPGLVLDHMLITCATLDIRAAGVVIRNSMLQGTDVNDVNSSTASYTISDSTVTNGGRDQCYCVGGHDFTAQRLNVVGGNRSVYCELRCTVQDSWLHGQILIAAQHGSGLREEQFTTAVHNSFECSFPNVNDATSLGCSAPQNGYADFAPIHDNTNRQNLYVSTPQGNCSTCQPGHPNSSYCSYGGNSAGKPYSSDPANGTHIVYDRNVFQRGMSGRCGDFETIGDYGTTKVGNSATGNVYDDGTPVPASQIG